MIDTSTLFTNYTLSIRVNNYQWYQQGNSITDDFSWNQTSSYQQEQGVYGWENQQGNWTPPVDESDASRVQEINTILTAKIISIN